MLRHRILLDLREAQGELVHVERNAIRLLIHLKCVIRHFWVFLVSSFQCLVSEREGSNRNAIEARRSHCLYACGFRFYFTPLPGFFSPFPHGTGSLSVDYEYLALEDGPPIFRQDFTCPALLVSSSVPHQGFRVRGYHPLWPPFPERSANTGAKSRRLFPFRSPLLWESRLISFPAAT